ncbi:MAG: acetyl-CoA carboxylase biotin carboxylase subunit [Candidatus Electrothrix sp. AW2]|nr:acetyl-CoA carboxylase biotin carboxylase subunit [Candidatus Electrothrix sp. AX1]MCI5116771.1 acetyl-CoA carboxylase biotin carboxylase subunit [Candidatus Electrothrix gigas]MCI5134401.1 acetyl-CoA carboxylase biotin carboxylase subunit [Candidatus Electrothrix gigas]MCI5179086.1 acetyl-CoA carboxylase biotin carboxylase subunit [Candidatus Electrothrix gigas]MCI5181518.1 acetyl-CoA carboxylase biotin carboxylase subunit [Candidatus Electrothrix gigas]
MQGKVLIANRGEIALRIMKACQDLGLEYTIIYTDADRDSEHVQRNKQNGNGQNAWRVVSYTDPNDLLSVADHTNCTAIHPGYGFFSEDYRFARRVTIRDRPLVFIGPSWEVIRDLGDKINTKRVANKLGIPTIPGTSAPIYNEMEAEEIAQHLFDLQQEENESNPAILIKAAAGGGGMGIEEVNRIEHFRRVYRQVQNYAKRQFGDGGVLIEQRLRDFNHLEVQLVCSRHDERIHFSSRNCTIQSTGRQKRVEAAPGFHASCFNYDFNADQVLDSIVENSLKLADYVKYDNVGTWEWIVSRSGKPYLLEVNTRIQVENDVSARISYLNDKHPNLLREQIRLALGQPMGYQQSDVVFRGASIELRIVAENTQRDFAPWIGTITRFDLPQYEWSVTYSHVPTDRHYAIPSEYDPNLALVLVWGNTVEEAKERARQFIDASSIEGVNSSGDSILTNLLYLRENLDRLLTF